MESASLPRQRSRADTIRAAAASDDAGYQAFLLLRIGFTVAPIAFGLDKFFNVMVDWPKYLAPWINGIVPGTGQQAMYGVGVIEIVAGLVVALKPRYGAPLVAAWLAGIIINLLTYSGLLRHRAARLRPDARRARAHAPGLALRPLDQSGFASPRDATLTSTSTLTSTALATAWRSSSYGTCAARSASASAGANARSVSSVVRPPARASSSHWSVSSGGSSVGAGAVAVVCAACTASAVAMTPSS